MVSFDAFKALDLRIAKILTCEEHPDADRLYVLTIDTGGETKTIVAGVRLHYSKEDLVGKKIVVVDNLEPATIRGVESRGMLLAARDGEKVVILCPEKDAGAGSRVS